VPSPWLSPGVRGHGKVPGVAQVSRVLLLITGTVRYVSGCLIQLRRRIVPYRCLRSSMADYL